MAEFGFVDVLASGPAGTQRVDPQIGFVDGDIDVLGLGQHGDGRGRGVNAPGGFGIGHALNAVHAGFMLKLGESATAADFGDDFLEAAHRAFARGHDLDFPSLFGRIALVHAKQIACKKSGLVAAGAGADFENDIALVHRILGQQCDTQLLLQRGSAGLEFRLFGLGDRTHLGVGCGICDEARDPVEFTLRGAVRLDRFHDRRQFGEFARKPYVRLGRQRRGEIAFKRCMTYDKRIEFLFR